jgi:hypothetical protein
VAIAAHVAGQFLEQRRVDVRLAMAAAVSLAACFLNPYGARSLFYPITQLGTMQRGSAFTGEGGLVEFGSPFETWLYTANKALVLYQPHLFLQLFGLVAVIALVAAWRPGGGRGLDWRERLVVICFAYVFLVARKNFGYFALATFPFVSAGVHRIVARGGMTIRRAGAAALVCATAAIVVVLQVRSGWFYASQRGNFRSGHAFNDAALPVRATAFLNSAGLPPGRMLNSVGDGGYLAFATELPVFIHGSLDVAGADFYRAWLATSDPDGLAQTIMDYDIQMVVVPYSDMPGWLLALESHSAWRCVYLDDCTAIYLRPDYAPHIPELSPPRKGVDYPDYAPAEVDQILDAALHRRDPGFFASLRGRHVAPLGAVRLAAAYRAMGYPDAAAAVALDGLRNATLEMPNLVLNLANAWWDAGDYERARRCYRAFLESRTWPNPPDNVVRLARERTGS